MRLTRHNCWQWGKFTLLKLPLIYLLIGIGFLLDWVLSAPFILMLGLETGARRIARHRGRRLSG